MNDALRNLRHRIRFQNRRNSAPAQSATGLKRSGAIRKSTNPLFAQESISRPMIRNRSNTMPTTGRDRREVIYAREDGTSDSDQSIDFQKQVRRLKPSTLARTNIYVQAMENLRHNEDLNDLFEDSSSTSSSCSSPGNSGTDTDTYTDSDNSQRWYDALEWDLERVGQLRDILRIWVEGDVPADEIGDFLVSCLYNSDDHLDNRVTRMVNNREPYAHIAHVLVEYLQIRDDENKPLWTQITPDDSIRRPGNYTGKEESGNEVYELHADNGEGSILYMLGPQPVRPVRWPFFESDPGVDYFSFGALTNEEDSGSHYDACDDHLEICDLARLGNAEHRVHVERDQNLTEAMTAELITPIESAYLIQTDESQDDVPAFRLASPVAVGPFHLSDLLGAAVE